MTFTRESMPKKCMESCPKKFGLGTALSSGYSACWVYLTGLSKSGELSFY